jgi:uncharacterized membrane protein (UPF0127 family)
VEPDPSPPPRRLRGLSTATAAGCRVPVAERLPARLLGLALLDRDRAGPGLLIPRCRSVHTFGMRFPIDVVFLGRDGAVVAHRRHVPPGRVLYERQAMSVLELPSPPRGDQAP